MSTQTKLNLELLAKELDARAFSELLDNNDIHYEWLDVEDISNPNDGIYNIDVPDLGAVLFIHGKLDSIN
jgi:hypothetical protein